MDFNQATLAAAKAWKSLPPAVKEVYVEKGRQEKTMYNEQYAAYQTKKLEMLRNQGIMPPPPPNGSTSGGPHQPGSSLFGGANLANLLFSPQMAGPSLSQGPLGEPDALRASGAHPLLPPSCSGLPLVGARPLGFSAQVGVPLPSSAPVPPVPPSSLGSSPPAGPPASRPLDGTEGEPVDMSGFLSAVAAQAPPGVTLWEWLAQLGGMVMASAKPSSGGGTPPSPNQAPAGPQPLSAGLPAPPAPAQAPAGAQPLPGGLPTPPAPAHAPAGPLPLPGGLPIPPAPDQAPAGYLSSGPAALPTQNNRDLLSALLEQVQGPSSMPSAPPPILGTPLASVGTTKLPGTLRGAAIPLGVPIERADQQPRLVRGKAIPLGVPIEYDDEPPPRALRGKAIPLGVPFDYSDEPPRAVGNLIGGPLPCTKAPRPVSFCPRVWAFACIRLACYMPSFLLL